MNKKGRNSHSKRVQSIPMRELLNWAVLTVFAIACIFIGGLVNQTNSGVTLLLVPPFTGETLTQSEPNKLLQLQLLSDLLVLTVPVVEPWEIRQEDLTRERVLYNILTKPGYRWILYQIMSVIIGGVSVSLGLAWLYRMRLASMGRVIETSPESVIEVSGSIEVRRGRGVIYWTRQMGFSPVAEGMEQFGTWLREFKNIRVVQDK